MFSHCLISHVRNSHVDSEDWSSQIYCCILSSSTIMKCIYYTGHKTIINNSHVKLWESSEAHQFQLFLHKQCREVQNPHFGFESGQPINRTRCHICHKVFTCIHINMKTFNMTHQTIIRHQCFTTMETLWESSEAHQFQLFLHKQEIKFCAAELMFGLY